MAYLDQISTFWGLICALGVFDNDTWDVVDLTWDAVLGANLVILDVEGGCKSTSGTNSHPPYSVCSASDHISAFWRLICVSGVLDEMVPLSVGSGFPSRHVSHPLLCLFLANYYIVTTFDS